MSDEIYEIVTDKEKEVVKEKEAVEPITAHKTDLANIENFDKIQSYCQKIKNKSDEDQDNYDDEDEEMLWIKYEKEWPKYLVFPEIEELNKIKLVEGYKINTNFKSNILDYYDGGRIRFIDNVYTTFMDCLYCDYCESSIGNYIENKPIKFYKCSCNADMCELCFEEKTEEIAIKNGAKNWETRKEALLKCFENHTLLYTNTARFETDLFKNFNSLVELVPIIDENKVNQILQNCNPASPKYKCLYIYNFDDHYRSGIFECKDETIESLMDKFQIYREKGKELDGWDAFYATPSKKYLVDNDFTIHYG